MVRLDRRDVLRAMAGGLLCAAAPAALTPAAAAGETRIGGLIEAASEWPTVASASPSSRVLSSARRIAASR